MMPASHPFQFHPAQAGQAAIDFMTPIIYNFLLTKGAHMNSLEN